MSLDPTLDRWRELALRFHAVQTLVGSKHLPEAFSPHDLPPLLEGDRFAGSFQGVLRFLLHVWNARDHHFDLGEVRAWDGPHTDVFTAWVTGEACCRPCHYF